MIHKLVASAIKIICGANVVSRGYIPSNSLTIYYANHSSHLDFLLIWAALPPALRENTRPIAAADYWLKGSIRTFLSRKVFNSVLIDRTSQNRGGALEQMSEALKQGNNLIIFPEGTRSLEGTLGEFKSGLYHLALGFPSVELVPVYLENLNRILPKGEFLAVPILSSVRFGKPLFIEKDETKAAFITRARESLLALKGKP